MEVKLTENEQKQVERAMKSNIVRRFLLNKERLAFEVGDVLIKKTRGYYKSNEWSIETISSSNKMPQRYVCIHKDDFGISYLKKLKVSTNTFSDDIIVITDISENTIFEVDPEYAESELLSTPFDIQDLHKKSLEQRKLIYAVNRKVGKKLNTFKKRQDFFSTLKVGDKFWTALTHIPESTHDVREYTVKEIKKKALTKKIRESGGWRMSDFLNNLTLHELKEYEDKKAFFYELVLIDGSSTIETYDVLLIRLNYGKRIFFKNKPMIEETR